MIGGLAASSARVQGAPAEAPTRRPFFALVGKGGNKGLSPCGRTDGRVADRHEMVLERIENDGRCYYRRGA